MFFHFLLKNTSFANFGNTTIRPLAQASNPDFMAEFMPGETPEPNLEVISGMDSRITSRKQFPPLIPEVIPRLLTKLVKCVKHVANKRLNN
jgi:hypothetical protein